MGMAGSGLSRLGGRHCYDRELAFVRYAGNSLIATRQRGPGQRKTPRANIGERRLTYEAGELGGKRGTRRTR